jgi:hypothetical protein
VEEGVYTFLVTFLSLLTIVTLSTHHCLPQALRGVCDPVFQFVAIDTAYQHVCEDNPRTNYVLTFPKNATGVDNELDLRTNKEW